MHLELVAIGTELVLGLAADRNGDWLGRRLAEAGLRVRRRTMVPDDASLIAGALRGALERTGAVLTTGGLGPTSDDLTRNAVAEVFGAPLRFDPAVWAQITAHFARLGRTASPANRVQAEVPEGARVLRNRWGTAPGLWLESDRGLAILLPGVPREMRNLVEHEVLPRLAARVGDRAIRSVVVRTTAIPESGLSVRVGALEAELAPLTLASLPGPAGVDLRLTAWDLPAAEAVRLLDAGAARLEAHLAGNAYGRDAADLAAVVLEALRARGWRLAVAESCTGGLVGGRVTEVPGSSDVFVGGAVCYADRLKTDLVGVPAALLAAHGAVSEEVAMAMAEGAARRFGAEAALGVTGIAGPGGGTDDKPVGTVCFGWVAGETRGSARHVFPGNRREVRERAAQYALYRLWRAVAD